MRARPHRLPAPLGERCHARIRRGSGAPGRVARRLVVGRARRRAGSGRAAADHVLAGRHRDVRGDQAHLRSPNLLNPGVIVRPARLDADLRLPAAKALRDLAFAYPNDRGNLMAAVHRCVGVGKCRADSTATGGVMCPSYLATRDEKDSTRGRARVLQEMANGTLVTGWRAPEVADALDLCLSCKGCASDCPTGIDMATYRSEVLYHRYRHRPRPRSHYALGWLPRWVRIASRAPNLANVSLRGPGSALAKRVAGVDQRRPLPKFARPTFRQWFADHPPADGDPVVLFVDTFTDHFS